MYYAPGVNFTNIKPKHFSNDGIGQLQPNPPPSLPCLGRTSFNSPREPESQLPSLHFNIEDIYIIFLKHLLENKLLV